jgi:hypothetical protein
MLTRPILKTVATRQTATVTSVSKISDATMRTIITDMLSQDSASFWLHEKLGRKKKGDWAGDISTLSL